jgi:formylmethanofuran dehydrogenase subunit E
MKVIRKGDEKEIRKQEMGIVECDWCHKEFSKENTRFWRTGARVCFPCFDFEDQRQEKIMQEFVQEIQCNHGNLGLTGW